MTLWPTSAWLPRASGYSRAYSLVQLVPVSYVFAIVLTEVTVLLTMKRDGEIRLCPWGLSGGYQIDGGLSGAVGAVSCALVFAPGSGVRSPIRSEAQVDCDVTACS